MLLHLLIPCGMTIVNLFISFINSLRADAFCGCMHDMELTLFQVLHCSSLACVIKLSIQPHPTYLSTLKIRRVELRTELFYAIIPTFFLCFLLICYPYISVTFLMFFILVYMQGVKVQWSIARHTPRECMMKPMVLHSNRHLHAVTPAKLQGRTMKSLK